MVKVGQTGGGAMIRIWWLRAWLRCYSRQEAGLRAELAGVLYMLERNDEKQRHVAVQLAMAETERRYGVVR